ncbi:MAG: ABC transporter ATP-binding protein [Bauldia sp.]|nr:ABC transporter ATP-binding protein [Bauldia sp.]
MARVRLSALRKTFGATVAVASFDLDVADGEFVALLGPSGCGKTTVLRMIAGIAPPDSGTIHFGDRRIDSLVPERRNVGLVFQSYALFPHMTLFDNVGFGLRMRRIPRTEIARRVGDALALVDLAPMARRYPRLLSGGQQQRVALARALVVEPDVLLLDEPLSNLDAKLREHLRDDILALQRRLGMTAIYVTHDQSEAMAIADRVVLMDAGRMIEAGRPRDLYRAPRHRFTAEFLGHTNIIDGKAADGRIAFPWGDTATVEGASGDVVISVRPEDIRLRVAGDGPGEVRDVTFLGADVEHKVALGGSIVRARSSGLEAPVLVPGTRVAIELPSALHILNEARA